MANLRERWIAHTNKKENKIFLIYKEIQSGAVAKCANISPYVRRPSVLYDFATASLLKYEENLIFFFNSAVRKMGG
jgi:hypothetical protein